MKIVLWASFYLLAFVAMIAGMYMNKDKIYEKTERVPVLNYTTYHEDEAAVQDTTFTESIDSLAVVIEGLLTQLTDYVTELHEKESTISKKNREINKLRQENDILKKQIASSEQEKKSFNKAQEQKRIQDLANTLSSMKPEILGPILANLPDELIKILYDRAKKSEKAVIIKALPPKRAGTIMADMAGRLNVRNN